LLAHVHLYPPEHNAGAEWMLHEMLLHLRTSGWDVRVLATHQRAPSTFEGIHVTPGPTRGDVREPYGWCDVAITHLDATRSACAWARLAARPLVHVTHNHKQLPFHRVQPHEAQLLVHNSEWIGSVYGEFPAPSIIVRPPVDPRRVVSERGDRITLVNLCEEKGAGLFWRLVLTNPTRSFLGVRGGYGHQIVMDPTPLSVDIIDNTPDVREVYARTRVLVVPSSYESWGRVAVEAAASGIPIIASRTPGLVECMTSPTLGECAIFADTARVDEWRAALDRLDDPGEYAHWSALASRRSEELDRQRADDLAELDTRLRELLAL
jgi:hypothetical protein